MSEGKLKLLSIITGAHIYLEIVLLKYMDIKYQEKLYGPGLL